MEKRNSLNDYNSIIKEVVAPILKKSGFKRSGNNFNRQINELHQVFNLQRESGFFPPSNASSKIRFGEVSAVTFTFNMGLIHPEIYKESKNFYKETCEELPKVPKEWESTVRMRLPYIVRGGDIWYCLEEGVDKEKLAKQIEREMIEHAMPWFEKHTTLNSLLELISSEKDLEKFSYLSIIDKFLIYIKTGNLEKARDWMNEIYSKTPQGYTHSIEFFCHKYNIELHTLPLKRNSE